MSISGILAVGNGEKCPFCDMIMEENTNTLIHLLDEHPTELTGAIFNDAK